MLRTLLTCIVASFFLFLSSCRNSDVYKNVEGGSGTLKKATSSSVVLKDKVLFHFSYKNKTWGYENTGQFIDSSGNIYSYTIEEGEEDLIKPQKGYISKSALHKNFQRSNEKLCTINKDEIKKLYPTIAIAAKGPLSKSHQTSYNQGDLNWYAYKWDQRKKKYARVLLRSWGDYSRRNLNQKAIDMYERLMFLMNNECES